MFSCLDPEYLIERKGVPRNSCCCSSSETESTEDDGIIQTKAIVVTAVQQSTLEINGEERKQSISVQGSILEQCGECNLHNCKYSIFLLHHHYYYYYYIFYITMYIRYNVSQFIQVAIGKLPVKERFNYHCSLELL